MPIQLNWKPNATPPAADRTDFGLEIGGEDPSIAATQKGRIKLVEVAAPASQGAGAGSAEGTAERLIATFHGTFHNDTAAPKATRLTFEIFVTNKGTVPPHDQTVMGFDPECIFGVDAFVFSFVNREFVVWFPFHVDEREGKFLEIQAVAEVDQSAGGSKEIGRSMILNLGIRRTHAIDTTSNLPNGNSLVYSADLVGNIILSHLAYLLPCGTRNAAQSTPDTIVLDPAIIPVAPAGTQVRFQAYTSGSLHVTLFVDVLDDLAPPEAFLRRAVPGISSPATTRTDTIARFKSALAPGLRTILTDAGFAGAEVRWSDDSAAASLVTAFKGAFSQGRSGWTLKNAANPLTTSFWNFFVVAGQGTVAGTGETTATQNTATSVGGKSVFLQHTVPIGSGDKSLTKPIEIISANLGDLLQTRSGIARTYKDLNDYNDAVDKVAAKVVVVLAHEVAHSLGMMHHCVTLKGSNYSEQFGSPVLSIMSSGVESGGFGINLTFHTQAKLIWQKAFGVTPTFSNAILNNKVWTQAEVFTMNWTDRMNKFIRSHGENSLARPGLGTNLGTNPPFTTDPPADPQRGTFH